MAANNEVTQYGEKLAYGIGSSDGTVTVGDFKGWLISATVSREGESKTYKNQQGITKTLIVAETWQQASCEVLLFKDSGGKALPKKGDKVEGIPSSVFNKELSSLRLETCSVQWQNEEVARVSITVREYDFD